jgi:hypothetical protein
MMRIMRTTVSISDELLVAAKRRARERGQTLGELIDTALQRELSDAGSPGEAPPVPVFRAGTGPRPGIDLTSNRALLEALDEEMDLDDRR